MWVPSKDPDDYLVGQPNGPDAPEDRARVPVRVRLSVYVATTVFAMLLAHALWNTAFPVGVLAGGLAQLAVIMWWRRARLSHG